jgi:cytidine deaminase
VPASPISQALLDEAIAQAFAVRERAHAPYSGYHVGAVLIASDGSMHVGCNVEVASYGGTVCAERHAVAAMIAAGKSKPYLCVVATHDVRPAMPCGLCRQTLVEVADDLEVLAVTQLPSGERVRQSSTIDALLPFSFRYDPATKGQPAG